MNAFRSPAYERFLASMKIGYEEWHDGVPYDLEALAAMTAAERAEVEPVLIARKDNDWRDSEALAQLATPAAWAALQASTTGPNREVRFRAAELLHAAGRYPDLSDLVVEAIHNASAGDGLSQCLEWAERCRTPKVIAALLQEAQHGTGDTVVHFVALLYYLFGKASEPFDWDHRPFFLKFHSKDPAERVALFKALCATLEIDPAQAGG